MRDETARPSRLFDVASAVVLRTPSLACELLPALAEGTRAKATPDAELAAAVADDEVLVRARLRALADEPLVRDGLFLASPGLLGELPRWLEDAASPRGLGVERSLVRYLSRMMLRSTPFGLFAGVSVVPVGTATRLEVGPVATARRATRIDNELLETVLAGLARARTRQPSARLRPGTSLYQVGDEIRYAELRLRDGRRVSELVTARHSPHLGRALELAAAGLSRAALVDALAAELPRVARADVDAFVDTLCDAQVLECELALPVTGREPLEAVLDELDDDVPERAQLASVAAALARIDAAGPGVDVAAYEAPLATLRALAPEVAANRQLQTDLVRPAPDATVAAELARDFVAGAALLMRLAPPMAHPELARFAADFGERYGDATVPLAEVLDEESGLGFGGVDQTRAVGSPLLRGLALGRRGGGERESLRPAHGHLLRRLAEVPAGGELVLDETDVTALEQGEAELPDAFAVIGTIVDASSDPVRRRLLVNAVAGPSGARLLGRFCHASPALTELVRAHVTAEERLHPEAIFAEIVHLPEGRVGNIVCRPLLRGHELPFLGRSGAPPARQLRLADLAVRVLAGRVVLWSPSLEREIVPRLSSAHNYSSYGIGTYRFLAALQDQDVRGAGGWSWGPLDHLPALPRVRAGHHVFQVARWNLREAQLAPIAAAARGEGSAARARVFAEVRRLRERLALPRLVVLVDADNRLPIDLDNVVSVDAAAQLLKTRQQATLEEIYPEPAQACVAEAAQRFAHEIVVLATRAAAPTAPAATRPPQVAPVAAPSPRPRVATPAPTRTPARRLAPGSEWLYATIEAGPATVDRLLVEVAEPLIDELARAQVVDRWFFVRYNVPRWQLRLRLHGEPARLAAEALPALHAHLEPFVQAGLVGAVRLETYVRETGRYGGPAAIELAEQLFCADSAAVLTVLGALGAADDDRRWLAAAVGLDRLLADLGLDLGRRLALVERLREAFARELGVDSAARRRIGERFREHGDVLGGLVGRERTPLWAAPVLRAFGERGAVVGQVRQALLALDAAGALEGGFDEVVASFTHMHVNRMVRAGLREQEAVLYELLARTYRSGLGRARAAAAATPAAAASVGG